MVPLGLLALAEAKGLDRAALATSVGLPATLGAEERVPVERAHALWRALLARFPSSHLGLELATTWRKESLGLLGYLSASAATLGEALDRFVGFQSLVDGEARLSYRVTGDRLIVRIAEDATLEALRQPVESLLASGHAFFALLSGAPLAARRVRMRHASSLARAPYRAFFGVDVEHGASVNELQYDASLLARPIPGGDPQLGAYLVRAAEVARDELERSLTAARADLGERVTLFVRERLADPALTIETVARALGLSVRSLQRGLAQRRVRFRELVDAERRRAAELLLAAPEARVAEVAVALGFSQTAAFTRAFRRWTRRSPAAYRRALLG